ncbi:MAG: hypothetical protein P8L85_11195 [Rubripirellula sp.]|nr:hypothetical protein [Rubripirellula sp.]
MILMPLLAVFLGHVVVAAENTAENTAENLGQPLLQFDGEHADPKTLVAETHRASLMARERSLRKTIARNSVWPSGAWGETLWSLAALQLNEKVDLANTRLLKRAKDYIALNRGDVETSEFKPEGATETPWAYFAVTDYVRILYLFHSQSPHSPGRLKPETEAAMKEALWWWVKADSKLALATPDHLLVLLGTENHDLTRRPNHYLVASLLKDDPAFRDRRFDDGHTATEHAAAYQTFFREWPRKRAMTGLWIEMGSNTYQKYSWPALFNLHELAPDPVVRKQFGLLLDLAFIEEAQISVRGRRGGGRSRADDSSNSFESYKNLLYASDDRPAGSSHSKVVETSRYQLPPAAILLDQRVFTATDPFAIRNRVPGELETHGQDGETQQIASDSRLVNYAWCTPHYLLGSTLQNPKLEYAGISRQKRWCGLLLDAPAAATVGSIGVVIEKTRGGRPQHSFWSMQHENVLLLQRIARSKEGGSYSTGEIRIKFASPGLELLDKQGWIFASNGKMFAGVKFLDGGHQWDEARSVASPAKFTGPDDTSRILLHAGDVSVHESFAHFQSSLLSNPLKVATDQVDYHFGERRQHVEMFRYDVSNRDAFKLPLINSKPIDLTPKAVYQSPYLNMDSPSEQVTVTVGPVRRILKFASRQ